MFFWVALEIFAETRVRLCMMLGIVSFQLASVLVKECGGPVPASQPERGVHLARVLIVDDHIDTADVMEMFLARAGYDVRAVYSGADALEAALEFTPDLAILDILLPDMTGYELATRLRASAAGYGLRLVALSSCSTPDHELAECFDEVARKPIDGAELRRLLRRLTPR